MRFLKTKFDGLYEIEIDQFDDARGYLSKFFDKDTFVEIIPHNINKYDNILAIIKK